MTKTLTNYDTKLIMTVKSFMVQAIKHVIEVCHFNSFPPYSNICEQGWSLPEWSLLKDSTLRGGLSIFLTNIKQGCKGLTVITTVESFMVQATEPNCW